MKNEGDHILDRERLDSDHLTQSRKYSLKIINMNSETVQSNRRVSIKSNETSDNMSLNYSPLKKIPEINFDDINGSISFKSQFIGPICTFQVSWVVGGNCEVIGR